MGWKRLQSIIDTFNSYYSFALVLYAAILYVSSHNHLFLFIALGLLPVLAAWGGYLIRGYLTLRNQRYGFKIISDKMTYEIVNKTRFKLAFNTKIQAEIDHVFIYPFGHRWSGKGEESTPKLIGSGLQLLGVVQGASEYDDKAIVGPYIERLTSEEDWRYWMAALEKPLYKGETADIRYAQSFVDEASSARQYINYFVRTPMKRLELNVKFPNGSIPKTVKLSYYKRNDMRHAYEADGLVFDPDRQWVTWVINKPKKGYCYNISWK